MTAAQRDLARIAGLAGLLEAVDFDPVDPTDVDRWLTDPTYHAQVYLAAEVLARAGRWLLP